jgi:hypothetical protein
LFLLWKLLIAEHLINRNLESVSMPEMISNLAMNYYFIVQFNNAILFHDEVYSRNTSCPLSLISAFLIIAVRFEHSKKGLWCKFINSHNGLSNFYSQTQINVKEWCFISVLNFLVTMGSSTISIADTPKQVCEKNLGGSCEVLFTSVNKRNIWTFF